MYLEADLAMKEEALSHLQPIATAPVRYRPPDQIMAFLSPCDYAQPDSAPGCAIAILFSPSCP